MNSIDRVVNAMDGGTGEPRNADSQIGELLIRQKKLTVDDVAKVVALARREQIRFGEAAIRMGLISEEAFLASLSQQFSYPVVTSDASGLSRTLMAAYQPFSRQAETLRELRSQLRLRWFNAERRMLAVCGAESGDGCSVLAANLAICFAQLGEKVLLIDGDLRHPVQQALFSLPIGAGLSNLLAGRGSMRDAVIDIETLPGLTVLAAGATPPNPQELLSRYTFRELLIGAAANYSVVIVDTPPASESADCQTIAAACGGTLLVARRNQTRLDQLQYLKSQLAPAGIEIVGSVIGN